MWEIEVRYLGKVKNNATIIKPMLKGKRTLSTPATDATIAKIAHQSGVLDDDDTEVSKAGVADSNVTLILTDNVFDNSSTDKNDKINDGVEEAVMEEGDEVKNSGDMDMEEDGQEEHQNTDVKKDVTASADPDAKISKQTFEESPPGGVVKKDSPAAGTVVASDDMPP